ncbi:MAG: transposase [Nitrospira sp.]|jgi:putative transposase|nr:transposase [Nitrospira sp.]
MAKCALTREQKKEALLKLDAGCKARDVSREHGVSVRTLYRWRANVMRNRQRVDGNERLRTLEIEHRRLRQRFAELTLDYATLRAALMKDVKGDC